MTGASAKLTAVTNDLHHSNLNSAEAVVYCNVLVYF
jgi:hypothetical protein